MHTGIHPRITDRKERLPNDVETSFQLCAAMEGGRECVDQVLCSEREGEECALGVQLHVSGAELVNLSAVELTKQSEPGI